MLYCPALITRSEVLIFWNNWSRITSRKLILTGPIIVACQWNTETKRRISLITWNRGGIRASTPHPVTFLEPTMYNSVNKQIKRLLYNKIISYLSINVQYSHSWKINTMELLNLCQAIEYKITSQLSLLQWPSVLVDQHSNHDSVIYNSLCCSQCHLGTLWPSTESAIKHLSLYSKSILYHS